MVEKYIFTDLFKKEIYMNLNKIVVNWKKEVKLPNTDINAPVDIIIEQDYYKWVLIELEIHRADPSNNIAKIAYWLSGSGKEYNITVIQIFTPYYNGKHGRARSKSVWESHPPH